VTHVRERFRSLPGALRFLVWIGIAAVVLMGIAIPVSSTHGGHGGPVTAHGAAAPATTTSTTVPPTTATTGTAPSAESELSRLGIAAEGPRTGYGRSLFPQWIDADHDGCDTRHEVLIAESAVPAHVGAGCAVTGQWYSAYDGVTTTDASTFDIDHVVPLAEAWDSGASTWDAARRTAYANDLDHPETLRAVSASANRKKGDDDPAAWKPPLRSDWCSYATDWISVKVTWNLTADPAEIDALRSMLATCRGGGALAPPLSPPAPTFPSTTTTTAASPAAGGTAPGMTVSALDCAGETVTVADGGPAAVDLTGWTIDAGGSPVSTRSC
jgi:Protein of unknown function (DUF1524)